MQQYTGPSAISSTRERVTVYTVLLGVVNFAIVRLVCILILQIRAYLLPEHTEYPKHFYPNPQRIFRSFT